MSLKHEEMENYEAENHYRQGWRTTLITASNWLEHDSPREYSTGIRVPTHQKIHLPFETHTEEN